MPCRIVQKVFETIALAKVSESAAEARDTGFLDGSRPHRDE